MRPAADVSIVIPNYQGADTLPDTLRAVERALQGERARVEVLVCDDASTDASVELVQRQFPAVRVLRRETNGGFSAACNTAARDVTSPLIYFLNSDAHPRPGFLEPLRAHFDDAAVFSVMSMNVAPDGRVQNPVQVTPRVRFGQVRLLRSEGLDGPGSIPILEALGALPTLYGSGSALLVRRDRFELLGGFCELFSPFYYEDVDLGWRAWRRGWTCLFEPSSVVVHAASQTISRTRERSWIDVRRKRNRLLALWRNCLDLRTLLWHHVLPLPLHLLGRLARLDSTPIAGLAAALRELGPVRAHRRQERLTMTRTDGDIEAVLDAARLRLQDALRAAPRAAPHTAPHPAPGVAPR
jgi:GT2 family glycosyltransferase